MGISIGPEEVKELTAAKWKELREGIEFMGEFLEQFPGGVKQVITLAKEGAKSQVVLSVATLLQPITNELDSAAAEITAALGIKTSLNIVINAILEVINSFVGFLTSLTDLFKDTERARQNLENLVAWLKLLNPMLGRGIWGIPGVLPILSPFL